MSLFRPRKPSEAGARLSVWEKLFNGNGMFGNDSNGTWLFKSGLYFYKPNFPPSASSTGGGWRWQKPYTEGDASLFIPAGVAINLSNENTLVTTGLTDLVTGELVQAIPGAWLALQDIPKSDGTNWNMPMPASQAGADGSVTGSAGSLKGDLDNPDVFWFYLDGNLNCG